MVGPSMLRILAGQVLTGFAASAAVLCLSLGARGQSATQSGGCQLPTESALANSEQTASPTLSSFEAPGAGTHAGQGTLALGINTAGVITGNYLDSSGVSHGFLRATTGVITTVNAKNAGTQAGQGTAARSINSGGVVTGFYEDSSNARHGFVRAANGTITSFDVPAGFDSTPLSINTAGVITGYYLDSFNIYHGFVRAANGAIISFDVPGAFMRQGDGTFPLAINDLCGTIVGSYTSDITSESAGFVRYPDNTIGVINADPVNFSEPTVARGISSAACATITGDYFVNTGQQFYRGFVRGPDGTFTSFDVPGARAQARTRVPTPLRLTRLARSRGTTSIPPTPIMDLCGPRTAPSPASMHQAPARGRARVQSPT